MLNTQSPIPLYHQLADILSEQILIGEYQPGDKIPGELVLADTHAIGRPTVRQAIDLLVRRKILIKKRGSGTFVCEQDEEVDLFSMAGTTSAFKKKGKAVQTELNGGIELIPIEDTRENPFAGQSAYFFSRLSKVDGAPVLIEDIYLDPVCFKGIDQINMHGRSLARIVEETYYMKPNRCKQNFTIVQLTADRSKKLDLDIGDSILLVKRTLHFPQKESAVYSELYCRTDRFVFSQTFEGFSDER